MTLKCLIRYYFIKKCIKGRELCRTILPGSFHTESMQPAFSLIEIAIALAIIGIMSTAGMGAIQQWKKQQKQMITRQHQEEILQAVALYAVRQHQYPLPADPMSPLERFGVSRPTATGPADQVGIVPFRTLGIAEKTAKDGYGRYFTYVAGTRMLEETGGTDICANSPRFPLTLTYLASDGQQINSLEGPPSHNPLVLVLISHGENGYGAFEGEIGHVHRKITGKYGPIEHANITNTQHFIVAPFSSEPASYFDDDIIFYYHLPFLKKYGDKNCVLMPPAHGSRLQTDGFRLRGM